MSNELQAVGLAAQEYAAARLAIEAAVREGRPTDALWRDVQAAFLDDIAAQQRHIASVARRREEEAERAA